MRIWNLTPHAVRVVGDDRDHTVEIEPSGHVVRLAETVEPAGEVEATEGFRIPVCRKTFGEPSGLPEEIAPGDVVIVSAVALPAVAAALRDRDVLVVAPDTGPDSVVRDGEGRIVGVRRLVTV